MENNNREFERRNSINATIATLGLAFALFVPAASFYLRNQDKIIEREKLKSTLVRVDDYRRSESTLRAVVTNPNISRYFNSSPIILYNDGSLDNAKGKINERLYQINHELSPERKLSTMISLPGLALTGLAVGLTIRDHKRYPVQNE